MKKNILSLIFFIASITLTSPVFANTALTCDDFIGDWKGTLSDLGETTLDATLAGEYETSADLKIKGKPPKQLGMWVYTYGTCQPAADGTLIIHITKNKLDLPLDLRAQLVDRNTLNITYLTLSPYIYRGIDSGVLKRQ